MVDPFGKNHLNRSGFHLTGYLLPVLFLSLFVNPALFAQGIAADSVPQYTLTQCIDYAIGHQPTIQQGIINTRIAHTENAIALAGWFPQVNISGNLQHYNSLPTAFVKNQATDSVIRQRTGVVNTAVPVLSVSQTLFNPSLLYAAHSAPLYIKQAEQITDSAKINTVAGVSKLFYSLLLNLEQISVLREDTSRLQRNVHDTYHQFVSGIVDETDYDEALITLNNSLAQLKQALYNIQPEYALLKQAMGFPPENNFNVLYDTAAMLNDIPFDTTQNLQYEKRIEFQQLMTDKQLNVQSQNYYRLAWLPTLGAFFDYDYAFQSNTASQLFANSYPYNYVGLSLNLPIFTGFARTNNLKKARLQGNLLDWQAVSLKSEINAEYSTALANYKSNIYNMSLLKDNVQLARKTYDIVMLQYQQGVVAYLNVITAESNLITSEIGYQNALFTLLSSKIDLQKSMGLITVNHYGNQ